MTIAKADYQGNVNIGFYGIVTDAYSLFAPDFKHNEGFDEPQEIRLGGTALIGLFGAGNSTGLVVPDLIEPHEEEQLDDADIDYTVIESRYTAFGNLVLCNDTGCVISPNLEQHADEIADALDVPVETGTVAHLDITGSCGIATNEGVLLHRGASEDELQHIGDVLGVEGDIGSVNFGTPYVHSGVLATSDMVLVGNDSTGPEIQRVQDALGFL